MKADPSPFTVDLICSYLSYEPDTGRLFWKARERAYFKTQSEFLRWNGRYAGTEACTAVSGRGYRLGTVNGKKVPAHRLAWVLSEGRWPTDQIDHIDGDRRNNRRANLREASCVENGRNMKRSQANTTGRTGVCYRPSEGLWEAKITVKGERIGLGRFDDFGSACDARAVAEVKYGYHPNHGRA